MPLTPALCQREREEGKAPRSDGHAPHRPAREASPSRSAARVVHWMESVRPPARRPRATRPANAATLPRSKGPTHAQSTRILPPRRPGAGQPVRPGAGRPGAEIPARPARQEVGQRASSGRSTRLGQLKVGEPQAFSIIAERQDAWVKYPEEPVGSVWLVRQPEGSKPPVVAFSAECPHLGCPVNLAPDRKSFLCPCHSASFGLDGSRTERGRRPGDGRAAGRALRRARPRGPRQVRAVPAPDRGEEAPCLTPSRTGSTTGPGFRTLDPGRARPADPRRRPVAARPRLRPGARPSWSSSSPASC